LRFGKKKSQEKLKDEVEQFFFDVSAQNKRSYENFWKMGKIFLTNGVFVLQ